MEILVNDQQNQMPLTPGQLELAERVARACLQRQAAHLGPHLEVSLTFVDDAEIQALNREHRGIDQPTDVLSFSLLEQGEGEPLLPPAVANEPTLLGDVVISLERAQAQAAEYGHSLERETGFLIVHGLLHLLGYDHGTPEEEAQMQAAAEDVLSGLGLER